MELLIRFSGFEQKLLLGEKPFFASIFEGEGVPPAGFNTLRIPIDLSDRSLLNWQNEMNLAREAIERGLWILWELQFHLSEDSLLDDTRFLTFQLNIDHFNEKIWHAFKEQSLGVSLFRGSLQKGELDYLKSLAALLDSEACCFIFIDTSAAYSFESYLEHIPLASLGCLCPILKGGFAEKYPWAFPALGWGNSSSSLGYCAYVLQPSVTEIGLHTALCLPSNYPAGRIDAAVDRIGNLPFRLIPESVLTQEWEGIDQLYVLPELITDQLQRKLQGFQAAGGVVIGIC